MGIESAFDEDLKGTSGYKTYEKDRNGYKIANPPIFSRISDMELDDFFRGSGYLPYYVEGENPTTMHKKMADVLDEAIEKIKDINQAIRDIYEQEDYHPGLRQGCVYQSCLWWQSC